MKAEFINGETVVHSLALHKHNSVVMLLGTLLSTFANEQKTGIVLVEKALVELTPQQLRARHLLFWFGESSYYPT